MNAMKHLCCAVIALSSLVAAAAPSLQLPVRRIETHARAAYMPGNGSELKSGAEKTVPQHKTVHVIEPNISLDAPELPRR